jgi:hypothetical protein
MGDELFDAVPDALLKKTRHQQLKERGRSDLILGNLPEQESVGKSKLILFIQIAYREG